MTELKPCPFCNGRAELKHYIIKGYEPDRMYYVECSKCGQTVVKGKFDTTYHSYKWAINKAIKAWNNRPDSWHTGTPTEENCFYALQCKGRIHHEPYYGVVVNGKFSAINYDGDLMPLPPDLVAWQKIEPYKETGK